MATPILSVFLGGGLNAVTIMAGSVVTWIFNTAAGHK